MVNRLPPTPPASAGKDVRAAPAPPAPSDSRGVESQIAELLGESLFGAWLAPRQDLAAASIRKRRSWGRMLVLAFVVASFESCHPNGRYELGEVTCVDCHAKDDPHRSKLGTDCAKCHIPAKGAPKFQHESMTRFQRTGAHTMPKPRDHTTGWLRSHSSLPQSEADLALDGRSCSPCHASPACTQCHRTSIPKSHTGLWRIKTHGFAAAFDSAPCATCHPTGSCVQCHRTTAPLNHRGAWGRLHGVAAGSMGNEACSVCHRPADCAGCHRTP